MKRKESSESYLIEVQPLVRGLREPSLTYFSAEPFTPGSAVMVPFRSKERPAVVLSVRTVADAKSQIRSIGFSLKKIEQQKERSLFSPALLAVVKGLSDYYATSVGDILSAITPASVLDPGFLEAEHGGDTVRGGKSLKPVFIQAVESDRLKEYKKVTERSFKKGKSVLLVAPTVEDAKKAARDLRLDFGDPVYELSSRLSKKKQAEVWSSVVASNSPVLVVLTPGFLSLPVHNVGAYIIEKVASHQFVGLSRPYLDARLVIRRLASAYGSKLILGDILIPFTETCEADDKALDKINDVTIQADLDLVDMADKNDSVGNRERDASIKKKQPFKLISDELWALTESALRDHKKVFWFVARRGLFPSTVCRDCGAEHTCDHCGATLVLHTKNKNRIFLCHRCGHKEETLVTCKLCGSWRLEPLGIGVDRVYEEAKKRFENTYIVSADTTNTKTKIRDSIKKFYGPGSGSLLVGTDLAFPYLDTGVNVVGVVSIDSRLSLPLYNAEESALRTLLSLSSLASESVLAQTRRADSRVFDHMGGSDLNKFRQEENDLRRTFLYPPHGTLVNIIVTKRKKESEDLRERIHREIKELILDRDQISLPVLRGTKKKGLYEASIILKLSKDLEENEGLREFIRSFPPDIMVRVSPENLW